MLYPVFQPRKGQGSDQSSSPSCQINSLGLLVKSSEREGVFVELKSLEIEWLIAVFYAGEAKPHICLSKRIWRRPIPLNLCHHCRLYSYNGS